LLIIKVAATQETQTSPATAETSTAGQYCAHGVRKKDLHFFPNN